MVRQKEKKGWEVKREKEDGGRQREREREENFYIYFHFIGNPCQI